MWNMALQFVKVFTHYVVRFVAAKFTFFETFYMQLNTNLRYLADSYFDRKNLRKIIDAHSYLAV